MILKSDEPKITQQPQQVSIWSIDRVPVSSSSQITVAMVVVDDSLVCPINIYSLIIAIGRSRSDMSMKRYFSNKRLLITGTTGFLGKVLLQKILYSLPEIDQVYILIRRKKGSNLNERFKKEIVSSPCFDRLRKIHENQFDTFISNKVRPIEGDLQKQGVGITQAEHQELINTCQVIINCAASIDFNARLDQAIESNIRGSLRMMELARQCKKLEIFTHISTCYVNCNLDGLIHEAIYDANYEPEEQYKKLMDMSIRELIANTPKILGKYPNSYTYTKALCERLMQIRKGDLPMSIVRPAIINTSYYEPFPGWIDSIAAASAYYMFIGLGVVKEIYCNVQGVGDTIPVDIVVANILVVTAFNAGNKQLSIYHVGSSDRNPIAWREMETLLNDFWNTNVSQSRLSKASVIPSSSKLHIKARQTLRVIPTWLYLKVSPLMGSIHVKNAIRLKKAEERAKQLSELFNFFVIGNWIYEMRNMKDLENWLTDREKEVYLLDCAKIDMHYFIILNNYGIQKYILKENIELPTPENFNLLKIRPTTYFSDIKWALSGGAPNMGDHKLHKEIKLRILSSSRVINAVEQEVLRRLEKSSKAYDEEKRIVVKEARDIVSELIGEFRMPVIRFLAWTLHKIFKRIYEKVNINSQIFDILRQIEKQRRLPIVLLPTHRSYIDFLIVSYIFFLYKLKLPYIISDEALMNASLIPFIIKSSGAFFFRPSQFEKLDVYKAIFNEYVQRLLINGNNLEFFLEGARSRTGKCLTPRSEILEILIETVQNKLVQDVCLVPVTINYEKVLEGDTFPGELLGEEKVEESLVRVLKAIPLLRLNFGRVYVEISEPMFLKNQLKQYSKQTLQVPGEKNLSVQEAAKKLAFEIIYRLNERLVIMSTGVVSAVLLMHRKGISEDLLIKSVNLISKYIVKKGYKIGGINQNSAAFAVRNAINYLDNITLKTKKSIFELQIETENEFQKILMLSYYRNTITHAFLPEAFLGSALIAFGEQLFLKEGVTYERLREQTVFLMQILQLEYIHPYNFVGTNQFDNMLGELIRNSIITKPSQGKYTINKQQQIFIMLYCSFLRSALECYWAINIFLLTIANSETMTLETRSPAELYDQIQWFIEEFYQQKVIQNYESCSLETIKNCLTKFQSIKLISIKQISSKETRIRVQAPLERLNGLESHLKKFLQNVYLNGVSSPVELVKKSGLRLDVPSKL